ncbi:MAG: hypothetical protein NC238_09235 [Dehalobacter sp.]|nr:hypothetical protein [Dehalobacter sp.]
MNIYTIVEGEKAAKKIYREWISYVNKDIHPVDYIQDVVSNNYYILAGYGQPEFYNRVDTAIEDVNINKVFDRLVVAVDSENATRDQRLEKVNKVLACHKCRVEVKIIIQHFCMETWFLGNKDTFRRNPQDPNLVEFMRIHNVRQEDPELLPGLPEREWNRSNFAYNYIKAGLMDKYSNRMFYTKSNAGNLIWTRGFFTQVKARLADTHHISSFNSFLDAFV